MASDCGQFDGEVFVDGGGDYIGDFRSGLVGWASPSGRPWPTPFLVVRTLGEALANMEADFWQPPPPGPDPDVNGFYMGSLISVVDDFTGPRSLEHLPALEVTGAGNGVFNFGFFGDQAYSEPGTFDNSLLPWAPAIGSRWIAQGWVRSVVDDAGFDAAGEEFTFGYLPTGWASPISFFGVAPLQPSWNFFKYPFTYDPLPVFIDSPYVIPTFGGSGSALVNYLTQPVVYFPDSQFEIIIDETKWAPKGRIHLKCLHLYPEGAARLVGGGVFLDGIKFRAG